MFQVTVHSRLFAQLLKLSQHKTICFTCFNKNLSYFTLCNLFRNIFSTIFIHSQFPYHTIVVGHFVKQSSSGFASVCGKTRNTLINSIGRAHFNFRGELTRTACKYRHLIILSAYPFFN